MSVQRHRDGSRTGLAEVFRNSAVLMWIVNPRTTNILEVNKAACTHFGYSRKQFLAMSFKRMCAPADSGIFRKFHTSLLTAPLNMNPKEQAVWGYISADGAVRSIETTWSRISHENTRAFLVLGRDTTEEQQVLKHLTYSEERFRSLVESMGDIVFTIDRDQVTVELFGKKNKTSVLPPDFLFLGKSSRESLGAQTSRIHSDAIKTALSGKNVLYEWCISDGTKTRHFQISLSPVRNEKREVLSAVGVARDISDIKALEHQREVLVNVASHEIRTPLATIKAYFDLLRGRVPYIQDPKSVQYIGRIESRIVALTNVINDLFDITRIRAGSMRYDSSPFDLDILLKQIINDMRQLTHIEIMLEGSCGIPVPGDRSRIEQVLINFIKNAIKYSGSSEKIVVRVSRDLKHAYVSVQDFGEGISSADTERIFEPFYRSVRAQKQQIPGLGLGLYIASEIIKHHGGTVSVDSKIGKGTTFTFSLPIRQKEAAQRPIK